MRHHSALIYLIGCILLSACSVTVTNSIGEDGSGWIGLVYTLPSSYTCRGAQVNGIIPADIQVTQSVARNGDTVCSSQSQFASLSELRQRLDSTNIVSIRSIEIADDVLTYDIEVFPRSQDASGFDMRWVLSIPGTLSQNNADVVDAKGIMGWELNINRKNRIYAQSQLPVRQTRQANTAAQQSSRSALGLAACLILLPLVAGGVAFVYWRGVSSRRQVATVAGVPAPGFAAQDRPQQGPVTSAQSQPNPSQPPADTVEQKLQRLRALHDQGLLNEEEYLVRRNKILEEL